MIRIESTSNDIYKNTKKLQTHSGRKKLGLFIIEGARLVRDAYKNGARLDYIILADGVSLPDEISGVKTYVMPRRLFDDLKTTVNSQGILAAARIDALVSEPLSADGCGIYLYLDGVSDPGNMGTILRSADAFGADGVILSRGCADIFSPKVIRSTMASVFNLRLFFDDGGMLDGLKAGGFRVAGTFPLGGSAPEKADYTERCVIVVGNEANGISAEIAELCDEKITIPMLGGAESLNVSVACGIMLYEAMAYRKIHGF